MFTTAIEGRLQTLIAAKRLLKSTDREFSLARRRFAGQPGVESLAARRRALRGAYARARQIYARMANPTH